MGRCSTGRTGMVGPAKHAERSRKGRIRGATGWGGWPRWPLERKGRRSSEARLTALERKGPTRRRCLWGLTACGMRRAGHGGALVYWA